MKLPGMRQFVLIATANIMIPAELCGYFFASCHYYSYFGLFFCCIRFYKIKGVNMNKPKFAENILYELDLNKIDRIFINNDIDKRELYIRSDTMYFVFDITNDSDISFVSMIAK